MTVSSTLLTVSSTLSILMSTLIVTGDLQCFRDRHPSLFHRKSIQLLQRILDILLAEKLLEECF